MPKKHRTLKEKKQSALRQQQQKSQTIDQTSSSIYSYESTTLKKVENKKIDEDSLLIVPAHYIKSDLKKTFYLCVLFILTIIAIHWYANLGGQEIIRGMFK